MSQSRQHDKSESSPTTMLFDVDIGRISNHHREILKSVTLNVLARKGFGRQPGTLAGGEKGVCYAKKDFNLAKHPEINVPNLQVVKLMKNFKSKEYVKETFAGMHYYWFFQWSLRQNRCRQTQILVTEMVTVVVQRGPCWGIRRLDLNPYASSTAPTSAIVS
ncbi:40S ribosomal protein S10-1 [Tanacetum coccineum]